MTMALRNVTDVALRVAGGEEVLYSESDPSLILTRVFRGGAWQDQWQPFRPPQTTAPVPGYPDLERLQQLARSKSKGPSVWELSTFYLHTPIQEKRGERPYFPAIVLVVDRDSSFILSPDVLGAGTSATERQGRTGQTAGGCGCFCLWRWWWTQRAQPIWSSRSQAPQVSSSRWVQLRRWTK